MRITRRRWPASRSARGTWTIEIGDDHVFRVRPGRHRGAVEGVFRRHRHRRQRRAASSTARWSRSSYTATTTTSKKSETIRMVAFERQHPGNSSIEPEPPVDADRIPSPTRTQEGVLDPMTGSMLRVPGNG